MPRLSIDLIPTTPEQAGNTPFDVVGTSYKGNGYYGTSDGFHTVAHVLTDWAGTYHIQGSLATIPDPDDWVTIQTVQHLDTVSRLTESNTYNFTGNYVWIRVFIDQMTHGTITKLQLNY